MLLVLIGLMCFRPQSPNSFLPTTTMAPPALNMHVSLNPRKIVGVLPCLCLFGGHSVGNHRFTSAIANAMDAGTCEVLKRNTVAATTTQSRGQFSVSSYRELMVALITVL